MSTPAQIAANQKNAQHSTGPKSEGGKAASCQNNFRHGFTGAFRVLASENLDEFNRLVQQLSEEHQPATPTETLLVTQMSQAWWLRTRALLLQNSCFTDDSVDQKQLALYLRYQTTNERSFHKALNELLRLRAEKRKAEIGFDSQQLKQSRARQQAELLATRACQQAEEHARKQAVEKRRQELHKWNVLLAQARVDNQELQNMKLETPQHHIPGRVQRIIAAEKAA